MVKRILSILLTLVLILGVAAGCKQDEGAEATESTPKKTEATESTTKKTEASKEKEPSVISAMQFYANSTLLWQRDDMFLLDDYTSENFNFTFNWEQYSVEVIQEKLSTAYASGNEPELLVYLPYDYPIVQTLRSDGYFLETSDILRNKMPNFIKYYGNDLFEEEYLQVSDTEGKYYAIPLLGDARLNGVPFFQYKKSGLDKLGLTVPTTTDELLETMLEIKEQDPDSYPIAAGGSRPFRFYWSHLWGLNERGPFGSLPYFYNYTTKKLDFIPTSENYRSYLSFLNKAYANGCINPEYPTLDQGVEKALDRWYFNLTGDWEITAYDAVVDKDGQPVEWSYTYDLPTATGFVSTWDNSMVNNGDAHHISVKLADQPEKLDALVAFLDDACTDEGAVFHMFGIEDKTFSYNADGVPEYINNVNAWWLAEEGERTIESMGVMNQLMIRPKFVVDSLYANRIKGYDELMKRYPGQQMVLIGTKFSQDEQAEISNIMLLISDQIIKYYNWFITGEKNPNDNNDWNEWINVLNTAGLDRLDEIAIPNIEKYTIFPK